MKKIKEILFIRLIIFLLLASPLAGFEGGTQGDLLFLSPLDAAEKNIFDGKEDLSPAVFVFRSQKEEAVEKRNNQRLALYRKKLANYQPPTGPMSILVTGYSSTPDQTWGDPFTTASGTHVHPGTMACPPQYPFGTKVTIEGRGTYVCEDRGGAIKGNHFDMWFSSRAEALAWGKRKVVAVISK